MMFKKPYIYLLAKYIKWNYGSNPFDIAKELRITLNPYGEDNLSPYQKAHDGYWNNYGQPNLGFVCYDAKFMNYNKDMSEHNQKVILAHMLGHYFLHKANEPEFSTRTDTKIEREADYFAKILLS